MIYNSVLGFTSRELNVCGFPCSALHLVFCYNYSLNCLTFHSLPSTCLNMFSLCMCEPWRMFHNSLSHVRQVIMGFLGYLFRSRSFRCSTRVKVSFIYFIFVRTSKRLIIILQLAWWIGQRNWGGWKQASSFMIGEGCGVLTVWYFSKKKKWKQKCLS